MPSREFGDLVRLGRAAFPGRRLSQVELSRETGINFWRLNRLERGIARPRREEIVQIAEALRLPALLELIESPSGDPAAR